MTRAGYASRLLLVFMALLTAVLAGCGGGKSDSKGSSQASINGTVTSLEVTPVQAQAAKGTSQTFKATAILDSGRSQDVTSQVTWSSSDTAVATMDADTPGLARAVAVGNADITASLQGKSASAKLEVTAAVINTLQVTPVSPSVAKGNQLQFKVTATLSDGSTQDLTAQATWTSATTAVATISDEAGSKGLATAVSAGSSSITAVVMGKSASQTLTVTKSPPTGIRITPVAPSLGVGGSLAFVATATYADGTQEDVTRSPYVRWISSNTEVATITDVNAQKDQPADKGRATALKEGTTTITVDVPGLTLKDSTTLTVLKRALNSVEVTPVDPVVGKGSVVAFKAYANYNDGSRLEITEDAGTVWRSSDESIAAVSNAEGERGKAQTLAVGKTAISATYGGVAGSSQLEVTAATVKSLRVLGDAHRILKGSSVQFRATGTYTDGSTQDVTDQVTWSSTKTDIAQVSNADGSKGLVTGLDEGSTVIVAVIGKVYNYDNLEVTGATVTSLAIEHGGSNPELIQVRKLASGTPRAVATLSDGSKLTVNQSVTWSSADPAIASVSNSSNPKGEITGVEQGTTVITAIEPVSGKQDTVNVQVMPPAVSSVAITPADATLAAGFQQQYKLMVTYADGTVVDFTNESEWVSSDTAVADFSTSKRGLLTALAGGQVTLCAKTYGQTNCTQVTVIGLDSIDVTPKNGSLRNGGQLQYAAVGSYADGSTRTLTEQVTWVSSHTNWVSISNTDGSRGLAKAVGGTPVFPVTVTISAKVGSVTGSTTVTRSF